MAPRTVHLCPATAFAHHHADGRTLRWAAIRILRPGGKERLARTCGSLRGCRRIIAALKRHSHRDPANAG